MIIFDTEYTSWEGSLERGWSLAWEHQELVQIGALAVDPETLEPWEEFLILIKPVLNPLISDYFSRLTGITRQDVCDHGVDLHQGILQFNSFCDKNQVCYCYGQDYKVISRNLALRNLNLELPQKFRDISPFFRSRGVCTNEVHSGELYRLFGLDTPWPSFQEHNALFDCYSILSSLRHLNKKEIISDSWLNQGG